MTPIQKYILRRAPIILFGVVFAVFGILFLRYQKKPVITGLDRLTAASGDRVELTGRHFGDDPDGGKLFIGSGALTSTGIIEWEDNRILARVPRNDGAVLVRVATRSGVSRGVVLGDALRFPRVDYGPWLPGSPFIEYANPSSALAGMLVTLYGDGFGDRRGGGRIWVNRRDESFLLGTEAPDIRNYVEAQSIALWSDREVRFWVPEGASSGNIYLQAGDAYSNPVFIEIGEGPGVLETGGAVQWSLRQDITVRDIGSFPGNSLYLHIPYPQPGPGQDRASVITPPGDDSVYRLRSEGNLDIFRIDELNPGDTAGISRQIVVTTRAVNAAVSPDRLRPFDTDNPDIAAALAADQWIRPDLVSRTASRITGNAGDVWTRSRLIYDYVRSLLTWDANPPSRVIPDYITTARADSEGYSFLFTSLARSAGVPSRPVGGILVTDDGQSRAWWWAEVWIQGLGWIPVDPALGDGALEFREVTDKAPDYYFGGLEGRHIAFSRGILAAGPLQPDPKLQIPEHIYTLQGAWEEVSGNLESYKSLWFPPRVTAAYPQE